MVWVDWVTRRQSPGTSPKKMRLRSRIKGFLRVVESETSVGALVGYGGGVWGRVRCNAGVPI